MCFCIRLPRFCSGVCWCGCKYQAHGWHQQFSRCTQWKWNQSRGLPSAKMSCRRLFILRRRWPICVLRRCGTRKIRAGSVGICISRRVACSLPAALLLVGWWKTGRLRWKDVLLLLPFFAVGLGLGLGTVWIEQHQVGAQGAAWSFTFTQRFLIAGRALWFYASKLFWPAKLTFIYPRWDISVSSGWQWLFPLAAVAVIATLWWARTRIGRGPLVAVLFFAGTLFPALGFVNIFPFRYSFVADHFQYLAGVGLIVLAAAGLT